ncbi:hypothetical protein VPHD69_0062 [Vibrio phage D69]
MRRTYYIHHNAKAPFRGLFFACTTEKTTFSQKR